MLWTMNSLASEIENLQGQCVDLQKKLEGLTTKVSAKQPSDAPVVKNADHLTELETQYLSAQLKATADCGHLKEVSLNPLVVSLNLYDELTATCASMTELLKVVDTQIGSLEKSIEHKGGLIKQQEEIHEALLNQLTTQNQSLSKGVELSQIMESKHANYLKEVGVVKKEMNKFMDKHFAVPDTNKYKLAETETTAQELLSQKKFVSMRQLYSSLLSLATDKPDEPYLTIGLQHWPQHIDLLLRFGIAVRNPYDGNQIKLANTYS